MCIPTISSFVVLCAQFARLSFPGGTSPDTMKQDPILFFSWFSCITRVSKGPRVRVVCVSQKQKVCYRTISTAAPEPQHSFVRA